VIDTIPPLEEGYITQDIALTSGRTLCSYIGNTFVYLCGASIGALAVYEIIVYIKKRRLGNDPDQRTVNADEQQ
jgi:apolipoprotein N-acyltransferase